ncbi:TIGR00341 family protein [Bacillus sp. HMF5848]|uniref:TIGR00341 family protein n=1 Tax=Bacillus sp. HMF5848 TaxID=2495421 RepID=UPI000F797724|nr:TIGR00341 family protein [Bacillus sp. HMF5848]RSK29023.1 TIGR00341 family protein [Bacillus sp. HMF5848]
MALQLIEAYVPKKHFERLDTKLASFEIKTHWVREHSEEKMQIRMLVQTEHTEEILNYLESVANVIDGLEVILLPVGTYITRGVEQRHQPQQKKKQDDALRVQRASRHELYVSIEAMSKMNITYILFVMLSTIVIAIGLVKNSAAIVIGGMVIAPLLGPIISLAFASILGDFKLAKHSYVTFSTGIAIALIISIAMSVIVEIPIHSQEFISRTKVDILDIVLALSSGTAGALSILKRFPSTLVGVMVAVALLPPSVVLGMTIGHFMWEAALGAFLLVSVNITSILLSAIVVFSLTGIRPVKYAELQKANISRKYSILFVSIIVIILIATVLGVTYR